LACRFVCGSIVRMGFSDLPQQTENQTLNPLKYHIPYAMPEFNTTILKLG
jgi:hypothetical protein